MKIQNHRNNIKIKKKKWITGAGVGVFLLCLCLLGGYASLKQAERIADQGKMPMDASGSSQPVVAVLLHGSDSTNYSTLEQAFAAAQNGDTIRLTADCSVTATIAVEGKSVILTSDAQYTVTDSVTSGSLFSLSKKGELTIGGQVICKGASSSTGVAASMIAVGASNTTSSNKCQLTLQDNAQLRNYNCSSTDSKVSSGAVFVGGNCDFVMTGGQITGNYTAGSGGAVNVYNNGTFQMDGGLLANNEAAGNGGAVNLNGSARFLLNTNTQQGVEGGSITGNQAMDGGAVYVAASAEFTMAKGTVSTNVAADEGTIAVLGNATIENSRITGNQAKQGGGIFISGGTVHLKDTEICDNQATIAAGSLKAGAGIYDNGSLLLQGTVQVTDNTMVNGEGENNIFLNSASIRAALEGDLEESSSMGFTVASGTVGDIATKGSYSMSTDSFHSDIGNYGVGVDSNSGVVYIGYHIVFDKVYTDATWGDGVAGTHDTVLPANTVLNKFPEVSYKGYYLDTTSTYGWYVKDSSGNKKLLDSKTTIANYNFNNGEIIVYANWTKLVATIERGGILAGQYGSLTTAFAATKDGDVVLLQSDCETTATITLSTRVTLKSAGASVYTITRSGGWAIFNVADKTTSSSNRLGELTIENVKLNGNSKAGSLIFVSGGVLAMQSGTEIYGMQFGDTTPTKSTGYGAVYIASGTVTMEDGKIYNNFMNGFGGGVYMQTGTFTMKGGSITENTSQSGSGVYVDSGSFSMTGGKIQDNHGSGTNYKGAGIFTKVDIKFGGSAEVSGNEDSNIYLNTGARLCIVSRLEGISGISMAAPEEGYFTTGLGELGTAANFTSDSGEYGIGVEDAEAFLGFEVTFDTQGGYFKEEEELEAGDRKESRTVVVRPGMTTTLPVVYRNGNGFVKWTYEESALTKEFTDATPVKYKMHVKANWGIGNVQIGSHLYYTLESAVKDANTDDIITVLASVVVDHTILIDKSVTITGETVKSGSDGVMLQVANPEDTQENIGVVFANVTLDGNGTTGSLLQVESGDVILDNGAIVTGMAKSSVPATAETTGLGAVYVNGGTVQMRSGSEVKDNAFFGSGAGVYVETGSFLMSGGTITGNVAEYEGGGIYVAADGSCRLTGGSITGNTAGNYGTRKQGSGIYSAGSLTLGSTGGAQSKVTIADNTTDNVYLAENAIITFEGALTSDSQVLVTLAQPKQGVFTSGFEGNGEIGDNLKCQNTGYTLAQNTEGEAYIGYKVTFLTGIGYFADEMNLGEEQRNHTRDIVYVEGSHPELPKVRNGTQALKGWFTSSAEQLTKDSVIVGDMTVTAQWMGSVCHIGEDYYASLEEAAADAAKSTSGVTIELLSNAPLTETLEITTDVTLDGSAEKFRVSRSKALLMFRVKSGGKLTIKNVTINGNDMSYSLLYVDGGSAVIAEGAVLTGCSNAVRNETMLDVSGPGTVYVGEGSLTMTGGSITANHPARGGGVYMAKGTFTMTGGSITNNQLSEDTAIYGAGVYLGGNTMSVSGNVVVSGNQMNNGVEQNIYYTTGSGYLKITGELSRESKIGVTPSTGPTGITSASMIDVTGTITNDIINAYEPGCIYSDVMQYEAVVDRDLNRIRLRKGHTITFDAGEGTLVGAASIDVVDGAFISVLPSATYGDKYFDGWYFPDGSKLTTATAVVESVTVTALYTDGKCEKPIAEPSGGTHYSETVEVVLTCATEGAKIYYTVDGSEPTKSEGTLYQTPLSLTENTVLRAIAVRENYSDSEELLQQYTICNITKIVFTEQPEKVFRGYSSTFSAKVTTGNVSTTKQVTWELVGDYNEDTKVEQTGEVTISSAETAQEITVRAVSADPSKYVEATVPICNQYTVTYEKNSPSGMIATGMVTDSTSPYLEDSVVTVLPNGDSESSTNTGYNCSGYRFTGWNTKIDGSGTGYMPGDTFTIQEDTVLYAQWDVVIVISKVTVTPKSVSVCQGENFTFQAVVTGKGNFTGEVTWLLTGQEKANTTISEEGVLHVDEEETARSLTVTAVSKDNETYWATSTVTVKELTRYTLHYAGTGGTGDMSAENGTYVGGTSVTIADCKFTRQGYDFISWNTTANGRGYELHPGDAYPITQDITLYAQWMRNGSYEETDPTEGTEAPPAVKEKTDKEYAEETIALIDAIGEVTQDSRPAIQAARNSYNALTQAQKELIDSTEYNKLLLREQIYNELYGGGKQQGNGTQTTKTSGKSSNTLKALAKGETFTKGAYRYKVTKSSVKKGTVTLVKPTKKTIKTVSVPAKVTYKKVTYKVTAISPKAFSNCKKLKKVTIGKNVTSIGSKAFYKDSKCEAITIRSKKIKKIGKKAFRGIAYRAYIKMPDSKYRSYEKLLQKSGVPGNLRLKTY